MDGKVERTEKTRNVEACPHYQLKIFEIIRFVGWEVDTEFVMYMIESAVSLEEVIIEPTKVSSSDEPCLATRRNRSMQKADWLRSQLKPGTTLQIRE